MFILTDVIQGGSNEPNGNEVFIEWFIRTVTGDTFTLLTDSQVRQLGGCDLDGFITIPSGAILDVQTPTDGIILILPPLY